MHMTSLDGPSSLVVSLNIEKRKEEMRDDEG
jgi:hypothetical protein